MTIQTTTSADPTRRLARIGRALTYAGSFDEVLDLTIEFASDVFASSRVVLMLGDDDGLLRVRASRGIEEAVVERFREPLDESLLSRLEELMGPDARDHFLGVPLVIQGSVIGLLAVRRERRNMTDEEEEWLLSALADQAAVALESTRHREVRDGLEIRVGELEREQSRMDQALKILSHDLRSPISAVQSYAALMSGEILGPLTDRQREALGRVKGICEHVDSIITTVLEMARLTEGPIHLETEWVDLGGVVQGALNVVEPLAESADIALRTVGESTQQVRADPGRLRQVLVQLLDNAVKYSPDGSEVTVEWKATDSHGRSWAEIAVADSGPGIPLDQHEAIFEPYVRHEGSEERARSGVGLGLAIARVLVERMGGTLNLDSHPGHGSIFRVRLPLESADSPDGPGSADASKGLDGLDDPHDFD